MGSLRLRSLIGIMFDGTEKKLAPVSSDVFISIPSRDYLSHLIYSDSPSTVRIPDILRIIISPDVFD
jgi:hypothetical protein